jgi:hypothetical protein
MHAAIKVSFTGMIPINLFRNFMIPPPSTTEASIFITEVIIGNRTAIFNPSKTAYNRERIKIAII